MLTLLPAGKDMVGGEKAFPLGCGDVSIDMFEGAEKIRRRRVV
jgi:hypothetical protein